MSNHPKHCKDSIAYGQALRVIERCSRPTDVQIHLSNLKTKLLQRNYPIKILNSQFEKALQKDRGQILLQNRGRNWQKNKQVRLIFTFNERGPPLHKWIRESKKLLVRNPEANDIGNNIQIGYRQSKNFKSILCGNKKKPHQETVENPGCFKCKKCRVSCPVLVEGTNFKSTNTARSYKIKQHLTCDSDYVIYLVTCNLCSGQYVGKSQTPFKNRHSRHKYEIKNKTGGLGHHYGGQRVCSYENLSVQIIDQVPHGEKSKLAQKETFWQHQLRCYVENGGHAHCYRKDLL